MTSSTPSPNSQIPEHFDPRYLVTLDELYHPGWVARKRHRMALLGEALRYFWPKGHPTRLIHLTGTNGKGSVAHYLSQGLKFAGPTGSWTSPHVFDYAERIHLSGEKASHAAIVEVYNSLLRPYQQRLIARTGGQGLSFAELGVLLALHLFERHGAVWAVIEVGAGGRYTPQMALEVDACALTNVGNDHPKSLGEHVWQRALEKGGIARPEKPLFTAAEGDAESWVVATAKAEGADCYVLSDAFCQQLRTHLSGPVAPHQVRNLGLACMLIRHFYPGRELAGLLASMQAHLPARFWSIAPNVIADVAHNADKIAALSKQLALRFPGKRFHFLLGLTRERDAATVFAPLRDLAESVTLTNASYAGRPLSVLYDSLAPLFPKLQAIADPQTAFHQLHQSLTQDQMLVLTGSAYMIDQALNTNPYLKHLNASFGWRGQNYTSPKTAGPCPPQPSSF